MIRVLIADDNHLMRNGLSLLLHRAGDFQVVGEARDGNETVRLARELKPDVILVDVRMPVLGGLEALRQIHAQNEQLPILVLAMAHDGALVRRALDYGARGYIAKHEFIVDLVPGIRAVCSGQRYLSPSVSEALRLRELEA